MVEVWWLSVFFFIRGEWVAGTNYEGWSPRPFPSETECMTHKAFAELQCQNFPLDYRVVWICNKGEPLKVLPGEAQPTIECRL